MSSKDFENLKKFVIQRRDQKPAENMLLRPSVTWNSWWCYCYHPSNSISHHTNDLHISIIGIRLFLCLHLCVYMWRSLRWCLPGWSDPPLHLLSAPHRDAAAAQLGRTGCCCRCLYQWHRCTLRWGLLPAPLHSWDLLSNLHRLLGPHHWWASPGNGQTGWSKCKFSVLCWMLGIPLITITCKTKMTELVPSVAVNSMLSCVVSELSWLYLYDRWTQIWLGCVILTWKNNSKNRSERERRQFKILKMNQWVNSKYKYCYYTISLVCIDCVCWGNDGTFH